MKVHVKFEDETKTKIVEAFSCPQRSDIPNQGDVEDDSETYLEFLKLFEPVSQE
jgi:hypothetical protein